MRDMYKEMDELLERGIHVEAGSGKPYFSGYAYETLYDWDQYFEGIVQLYMGRGTKYLISGVDIFLDNQDESGFIPRAIDPPGMDRPNERSEMVKPFLSQILLLCLKEDGHIDFLRSGDRFQRLYKYLKYWLFGLDKRGKGLSYWRSAPHTGMDNQRERAGDWGSDYCEGIDLNSFLCREIKAFMLLCGELGFENERAEAKKWLDDRIRAVNEQCWDEKSGFYYDIDARTGERMEIRSVAGFSLLWAGIASGAQAERLVKEHLLNENEFWRPWPVPAYSAGWAGYENMYLPGDIGCAWRRNTWVPTNYYVFEGLRKYGYDALAYELADKTDQMVRRAGFREYYASEVCAGCGLDPFWGWSLLAPFMPYEYKKGIDPTALDTKRPDGGTFAAMNRRGTNVPLRAAP